MERSAAIKVKSYYMIYGKKCKAKWLDSIDGGRNYGEFCRETFSIKLERGLSGEKLKKVLLHELIHALFYRIKMYAVISHEVEELAVENLDEFLFESGFVK